MKLPILVCVSFALTVLGTIPSGNLESALPWAVSREVSNLSIYAPIFWDFWLWNYRTATSLNLNQVIQSTVEMRLKTFQMFMPNFIKELQNCSIIKLDMSSRIRLTFSEYRLMLVIVQMSTVCSTFQRWSIFTSTHSMIVQIQLRHLVPPFTEHYQLNQ